MSSFLLHIGGIRMESIFDFDISSLYPSIITIPGYECNLLESSIKKLETTLKYTKHTVSRNKLLKKLKWMYRLEDETRSKINIGVDLSHIKIKFNEEER
jgi:hypothetical protein